MEKIKTVIRQNLNKIQQQPGLEQFLQKSDEKSKRLSTIENNQFFHMVAKRIDFQFTTLYQQAWTSKYLNEEEKMGLLNPYVQAVKKMGGVKNCAKIFQFLLSSQNRKYVDFPPNPQQFLLIYYDLPKEIKTLPPIPSVKQTLKSRIWSGIAKMDVGADLRKSHSDIIELVHWNYNKIQKHREKYGKYFPGKSAFQQYEVQTEIE